MIYCKTAVSPVHQQWRYCSLALSHMFLRNMIENISDYKFLLLRISEYGLTMMPLDNNPLFNTLRPRQNGRHFADDIFKCIFLNENVWISIKISLKFVPKGPINDIPALVQIMAWRRQGDKPLSEPMMVNLLTHICVTRPQWVKSVLTKMCNVIWLHLANNIQCTIKSYLVSGHS